MSRNVNISRLIRRLREQLAKDSKENKGTVVVGYTMNYAIYVHEDPNAKHAEGKSWRYLATPAHALRLFEFPRLARETFIRTGSVLKAILVCGLRLQRASQEIVPIDTGALRASAFTCFEEDLEQVSKASQARGEAIRKAADMRQARAVERRVQKRLRKQRGLR
jgi:hypothetical protein